MAGTQSPILVTGAAGFIGFHVAKRLLDRGDQVIGLDNLNDYYDVRLKQARLAQLTPRERFSFVKLDLSNRQGMRDLFADEPIRRVVHLASQAGVRYSLVNPHAYAESNIEGFMNILEGCRHGRIDHLVCSSKLRLWREYPPAVLDSRQCGPSSLVGAASKKRTS